MVGLRILLEATNKKNNVKNPQVIYKTISIKPIPPPSPLPYSPPSSSTFSISTSFPSCPLPPITFLDACFLCNKRLLPEEDIYMYKGDRAFCSVECRYRQIWMDEESVKREKKCSLVGLKPTATSSSPRYQRKTRNNRPGGGGGWFA